LDFTNHVLQTVICSRVPQYSQQWICKVNEAGHVSLVQEDPANKSAEVPRYFLDVYLSDFLEWMLS